MKFFFAGDFNHIKDKVLEAKWTMAEFDITLDKLLQIKKESLVDVMKQHGIVALNDTFKHKSQFIEVP